MSSRLDSHTEGSILSIEILGLADVIAQEHLTVSVDNLIDLYGTHNQRATLISLVVEVELRTVTIPQSITNTRHLGLVLAGEQLLGCILTIHRIVPLRLDLWAFQKRQQRILRTERFPALLLGYAVELFEYLLGCIYRRVATAQGDNLTTCRLGYLQGVAVAELSRYETHITLGCVLTQLVTQTGFALGQGVVIYLTELLRHSEDVRPYNRGIIVARSAHCLLCIERVA